MVHTEDYETIEWLKIERACHISSHEYDFGADCIDSYELAYRGEYKKLFEQLNSVLNKEPTIINYHVLYTEILDVITFNIITCKLVYLMNGGENDFSISYYVVNNKNKTKKYIGSTIMDDGIECINDNVDIKLLNEKNVLKITKKDILTAYDIEKKRLDYIFNEYAANIQNKSIEEFMNNQKEATEKIINLINNTNSNTIEPTPLQKHLWENGFVKKDYKTIIKGLIKVAIEIVKFTGKPVVPEFLQDNFLKRNGSKLEIGYCQNTSGEANNI